jgi:hypothetical protein
MQLIELCCMWCLANRFNWFLFSTIQGLQVDGIFGTKFYVRDVIKLAKISHMYYRTSNSGIICSCVYLKNIILWMLVCLE